MFKKYNHICLKDLFPGALFNNNTVQTVLNERTLETQIVKLADIIGAIPMMPYDIEITYSQTDETHCSFTGTIRVGAGTIDVYQALNAAVSENITYYLVYDWSDITTKLVESVSPFQMELWHVNVQNNQIHSNNYHNIYYDDHVLVDRVDSLESRMDNAESDITSLESRMSTAETDINNLESRMTTAENDIDGLDTRLTTAESNITSNDNEIDGLKSRMTTAEGDIGDLEDTVNGDTYGNQALSNKINTLQTSVTGLDTRVTTIEDNQNYQDLEEIASEISSQNALINTANQNASNALTRANTAVSYMNELQATFNEDQLLGQLPYLITSISSVNANGCIKLNTDTSNEYYHAYRINFVEDSGLTTNTIGTFRVDKTGYYAINYNIFTTTAGQWQNTNRIIAVDVYSQSTSTPLYSTYYAANFSQGADNTYNLSGTFYLNLVSGLDIDITIATGAGDVGVITVVPSRSNLRISYLGNYING